MGGSFFRLSVVDNFHVEYILEYRKDSFGRSNDKQSQSLNCLHILRDMRLIKSICTVLKPPQSCLLTRPNATTVRYLLSSY